MFKLFLLTRKDNKEKFVIAVVFSLMTLKIEFSAKKKTIYEISKFILLQLPAFRAFVL